MEEGGICISFSEPGTSVVTSKLLNTIKPSSNNSELGTVITLHGFKFERFVVGASGSLRKGQDNGAMHNQSRVMSFDKILTMASKIGIVCLLVFKIIKYMESVGLGGWFSTSLFHLSFLDGCPYSKYGLRETVALACSVMLLNINLKPPSSMAPSLFWERVGLFRIGGIRGVHGTKVRVSISGRELLLFTSISLKLSFGISVFWIVRSSMAIGFGGSGVGAAWKTADVEPGSTVVIFGLGSNGLAVVSPPACSCLWKQFGITEFVNSKSCGDKPVSQEFQLDKFVTHEVNFEDINNAFELLIQGKSLLCVI
ncbi:hypothetical protein T459_02047 [Capsicum annuum]|uniref:Uncharacterized protein n=1 Tax=Capsicum annuum TaxID=4072 RepID=A0A2G3AIU7_CAPAN|nr:hypothetical protein T459_02047 [Capsicum annuum]